MKRKIVLAIAIPAVPILSAAIFLSFRDNIPSPPVAEAPSETVRESGVRKPAPEVEQRAQTYSERVWTEERAEESVEEPVAPTREEITRALEEEILELLASGEIEDRRVALAEILPRLVRHDVEAAVWLIEETDPGPLRDVLLRGVSQAWAESEPRAALEWASNLPEEGENERVMAGIIMKMAHLSGTEAMDAAERYDLQEYPSLLGNLVQAWSDQDMPSALNWLKKQPPGEKRDIAAARIAFIQSRTDPAAAAELVVNEMPYGPAQVEAVVTVVHQWALRDFSAAADWVESFPDDELRERAMNELAGISFYQEAHSDSQAQ